MTKKEYLEKIFDVSGAALIQLDARKEGVSVPSVYLTDPALVLRLGFGLTPPISDLAWDDNGIVATLTFSSKPFYCVIPWSAIYAICDHNDRRNIWPKDVPTEALSSVESERPKPKVKPKKGKPKLTVIKGGLS